ncbi:AEC family transporter [Alsobacter sp. SYSU M60028]|uniref:AEC family transporter n=1 Tax=Alsobacter ponti TaxID=2962936 RepID=A0ABT1LKG2_9HYPH|nr:AEC family transporter [Alsobacter ponti]
MTSVASLALPFFGLIFLGFGCGKLLKYPEAGLQWMNFFIVYVALPSLFFKLISAAPLEQLANWPFVMGTTAATFIAFCIAFAVGMLATRGNIQESTVQGVVGAYANIGYMGPGLTIAALGQGAIVPTALIFVFDNILLFTLVPFMMAMGRRGSMNVAATAWYVVKRVVTHPFNVATAVAVLAAYLRFTPPEALDAMISFLKNAAAPCALFTMGVTVALRPLKRVPYEMPALMLIKIVLHPLLVWLILSWLGDFGREWTFTAVLMAALPPALNVFVIANQYQVYVERASTAILLGTLISVVTVTSLLVLMVENRIPYDLFP